MRSRPAPNPGHASVIEIVMWQGSQSNRPAPEFFTPGCTQSKTKHASRVRPSIWNLEFLLRLPQAPCSSSRFHILVFLPAPRQFARTVLRIAPGRRSLTDVHRIHPIASPSHAIPRFQVSYLGTYLAPSRVLVLEPAPVLLGAFRAVGQDQPGSRPDPSSSLPVSSHLHWQNKV